MIALWGSGEEAEAYLRVEQTASGVVLDVVDREGQRIQRLGMVTRETGRLIRHPLTKDVPVAVEEIEGRTYWQVEAAISIV